MFQGFATMSIYADDVQAAADWYRSLFGSEPYFRQPADAPAAYVEFRIGQTQAELGIIDRRWARHSTGEPTGAIVYWHVDDLPAVIATLVALGATELEPMTDRGSGFVTASFADPFGNTLGVMTNPHFVEMDRGRRTDAPHGDA